MLGLAGIDPPACQAARLAPLTSADADTLISSIRSGPLPPSHRAAPGGGSAAEATLRDALLRVSRLTEDLPEISELDLNPVIARRDGDVESSRPASAFRRRSRRIRFSASCADS